MLNLAKKKIQVEVTQTENELLMKIRRSLGFGKSIITIKNGEIDSFEAMSQRQYELLKYIKEKLPFGSCQLVCHAGEPTEIRNPRSSHFLQSQQGVDKL